MSRYYVNKFLYTVDRDPELLRRYAEEPRAFLDVWEQSIGPQLSGIERSTVNSFTQAEREAVINHDVLALFEMGAHFFLSLTIFIAIYDEEWTQKHGPLSFQRDFAKRLEHWTGRDYPPVGP